MGELSPASYYQSETITCMLTVPICIATLIYLLTYIGVNKLSFIFYLRPLSALVIMLLTYLMTAQYLLTLTPYYKFKLSTLWGNILYNMEVGTWAIRVIPTLLYTWQFYDVVEPLCFPNRSNILYYSRQGFTFGILGLTIITFFLNNIWSAKIIWFLRPNSFDLHKSDLYAKFDGNLRFYQAFSQVACCFLSTVYILATVWLISRLSQTEQFQGMQLDKLVAGAHAATILFQSLLMVIIYY